MTMHLSDQGLIVILVVAHRRMTAGQDCPWRIPDPDALLAVAAWVKAKCRVAGAAQRAQGRPLRAIAAEMLGTPSLSLRLASWTCPSSLNC